MAAFIGTDDYRLLAKMRNVVASTTEPKLTLRRLKSLAEKYPEHVSGISMGSETLDWYFELGDTIVDGIVVRDVFWIGEQEDIQTGALKVLRQAAGSWCAGRIHRPLPFETDDRQKA